MTEVTPKCWKCGYDLRGLRVEELCPECGTAVWSLPAVSRLDASETTSSMGQSARHWGVISLLLLLIAGPVAALTAVPAIRYGLRAKRLAKSGLIPEKELIDATVGVWCGVFVIAVLVVVGTLLALVAFW